MITFAYTAPIEYRAYAKYMNEHMNGNKWFSPFKGSIKNVQNNLWVCSFEPFGEIFYQFFGTSLIVGNISLYLLGYKDLILGLPTLLFWLTTYYRHILFYFLFKLGAKKKDKIQHIKYVSPRKALDIMTRGTTWDKQKYSNGSKNNA